MNEFEARLKQLLNEDVDSRLGRPRPAPPQHLAAPDHRRRTASRARTRWLPPLIAAAVIALVLAGTAAAGELLSSGPAPVEPATGVPMTVAPTSVAPSTPPVLRSSSPAPRATPTRTATPVATRTRTEQPSTASTQPRTATTSRGTSSPGTTVELDGARIALPVGWVAHEFSGAAGVTSWCLRPRGRSNDTCTVTLLHVTSSSNPLDSRREGLQGDAPQYICGQSSLSPETTTGTTRFGGRTAQRREFVRSCAATGRTFRTVQYLVARAPAWGLVVMGATSRDRDVEHRIVDDSTLPD